MNRIASIIPAAGLSSRMGRFKPLLPLGKKTLVEQVIETFRKSGVDPVLVVTGHRRREVAASIPADGVLLVVNPAYRDGMYTSVVSGVRHLPLDTAAFFVMPVDIPLVRPWTIQRLMDGYARFPGRIIYPCFLGRRGHPPLLPMHLAQEIAYGERSENLRNILARHEGRALEIEVPDRHILFDVDTPEDFQTLLSRWAKLDVPSPEECEVILGPLQETAKNLVNHGHTVAGVAQAIARALVKAGVCLDEELLYAGALLHDIAKGRKDHARVGGELLRRMGFARTGDLVAAHGDVILSPHSEIHEAEVLYLADKVVQGDRLVNLNQRFASALARFGSRSEARVAIKDRWDRARLVKERLEQRIGQPLETIVATAANLPPDDPS